MTITSVSSNATESSEMLTENELEALEGREIDEQIDLLNAWLQKATMIRKGAENMLMATQSKGDSRGRIETELVAAQDRIKVIKERIDQLKGQLDTTKGLRKRPSNNRLGSYPQPSAKRVYPGQMSAPARVRGNSVENKDDYRTAISTATTLIRTLKVLPTVLATSPLPYPLSSSATASSSQIPLLNSESDLDQLRAQTIAKLTSVLYRNLRVRYEIDVEDLTAGITTALSDHATSTTRALAYRLLRLILPTPSVQPVVLSPVHGMQFYLIRSLLSKHATPLEREETMLFIRAILELGSPYALDEGVVRTLVAVAESESDHLRGVALETLIELLLLDTPLAARTDTIPALVAALVDGPKELGPALTQAFLVIIDSPRTRGYLTPGIDLEIILSGITDAFGRSFPSSALLSTLNTNNSTIDPANSPSLTALRRSATLTNLLLRSWPGLLYLCTSDFTPIRSIVETLRVPSLSEVAREMILDSFFELFGIKAPEWHAEFVRGRRLTMYHKRAPAAAKSSGTLGSLVESETVREGNEPSILSEPAQQPEKRFKTNLVDQYLALLVVILHTAGLFNVLIFLLEETPFGTTVSRKAALLVGEILEVSNRVLPANLAASIQSLKRLFELATSFTKIPSRIAGTSTLSLIDSLSRNKLRLQVNVYGPSFLDVRNRSNSASISLTLDEPSRRQNQIEQVKKQISGISGVQVDDRVFQTQLLESGVMSSRNYKDWNIDALLSLVEGPLTNSKRLEEALRVSKFGRRLIQFFHPFEHKFSDMKNNKSNQKWIRLGTSLLKTLLGSQDGQRFLTSEDMFLKQVVDCFAQLDPFNPNPTHDPVFSPAKIADTLTYGYFEMLGTLSQSPEGIELLEKFHVFTALYHVSELKSRQDLIALIIQNLDYTIDGHQRIVLSKALTSSYKDFRLFATQKLGQLILSNASTNMWSLRLLVNQLYDTSVEVCELAVHYLEESCANPEVLREVVEMQPILDHLQEIAHPLLLKFMSTPMGFRYLHGAEYIEREMSLWFDERNYHYVIQMEVYLSRAFGGCVSSTVTPSSSYNSGLSLNINPNHSRGDTNDEEDWDFDSVVPPHFYGELAKTDLGCRVLEDSGHVSEFARFIRQHGLESEDADLILKLKSVLWAVGNIGATEGGLPLIEKEDIVGTIVQIAAQSLVLSIRGTCFFVLGLISSTHQGVEILLDYGWESTISPSGRPTGLCIPLEIREFVEIPLWEPWSAPRPSILKESDSQMETELETAIYTLANPVVHATTCKGLQKLKARRDLGWVFDSTSMYFRALHAIMTGRYRLSTRKFIFDLFDFQLDSGLVKQLNGMAEALVMDEQDVYEREEEELLGRKRGHGEGLSGVEASGIGLMNGVVTCEVDGVVDLEMGVKPVEDEGVEVGG